MILFSLRMLKWMPTHFFYHQGSHPKDCRPHCWLLSTSHPDSLPAHFHCVDHCGWSLQQQFSTQGRGQCIVLNRENEHCSVSTVHIRMCINRLNGESNIHYWQFIYVEVAIFSGWKRRQFSHLIPTGMTKPANYLTLLLLPEVKYRERFLPVGEKSFMFNLAAPGSLMITHK